MAGTGGPEARSSGCAVESFRHSSDRFLPQLRGLQVPSGMGSLHRDGTVLLFLTIPLLIFGAHCLDLMDKHDEEASNSRLKLD